MEKPIYSVVYYLDGKSHQFKCASDSLLDARSLATECFEKYNTRVEIVKSQVSFEVVDFYCPFNACILVDSKIESFHSREDLFSRVEFLLNIGKRFNFLG